MNYAFIFLMLLAIAPAVYFFFCAIRNAGPEFSRRRLPFKRYDDEASFWFWVRSLLPLVWGIAGVAAIIQALR